MPVNYVHVWANSAYAYVPEVHSELKPERGRTPVAWLAKTALSRTPQWDVVLNYKVAKRKNQVTGQAVAYNVRAAETRATTASRHRHPVDGLVLTIKQVMSH